LHSVLHHFECPRPGVQIARSLTPARIGAVVRLIPDPLPDGLSDVSEADRQVTRDHPPSGWDAIQCRISSALHTVTRTESFTG